MKRLFILPLIFLLFCSANCKAGWVDDWINQKTYTSAQYFEGQKRGYFTAGGFSARYYHSNDYLMSITPPQFKIGCGGIDLFMGGFSFLNTNYLLKKLKRILGPGAAAAAFDIALNTLCEPCAKTMKSMEAIVDRLNQLQFADCQASKVVATYVLNNLSGGKLSSQESHAVSDFLQSSGIKNLYAEVKKDAQSHNNTPPLSSNGASINDLFKGCPASWQELFAQDGSILKHMADKEGYPLSYVRLIRGFIGDIIIFKTNNTISFKRLAPCTKNKVSSVDNFLVGNAYQEDKNGICYPITDTHKNLLEYVHDKLSSIAKAMKNGTPLTSSEINFIQHTPISIYTAIRAGVVSGQESEVITNLSDPVARAYAYEMMLDMYQLSLSLLNAIDQEVEVTQGAKSGQPAYKCQLQLAQGAEKEVEELQRSIYRKLSDFYYAYVSKIEELNGVIQYSRHMEHFENIAQKSISTYFDSGLSKRLIRQ